MSINILDFEKPIAEVAEKIEALQLAASDNPELLPQKKEGFGNLIVRLKQAEGMFVRHPYFVLTDLSKYG